MQGGTHSSTEPTSGHVIGAPDNSDALAGEARPARAFLLLTGIGRLRFAAADPVAPPIAVTAGILNYQCLTPKPSQVWPAMKIIYLMWPWIPMLSFLLIVWLEPVRDTAALVVPIVYLAPVWFGVGLFVAMGALARCRPNSGDGTTDVSGSRHLVISIVLNLIWLVFILVALFGPFVSFQCSYCLTP